MNTMMPSAFLLCLPDIVLMHILKNLLVKDLFNIMLTCKTLYSFIRNNETLWEILTERTLLIRKINSTSSTTSHLSWYTKCRISQNWLKGIYRNKVVIGHNTAYMPWIIYHDSQWLLVATGSQLRCYTIKRGSIPECKQFHWQIDVPKIARQDKRTNDISRFVFKNNLLVCGNRDGCIAVYSMSDLRHRPTLLQHIVDCHENGLAEVSAVETVMNSLPCLVSVSSNSPQLQFWSYPSDIDVRTRYTAVRSVNIPHNNGLRCLAVNCAEDRLAVGLDGNSKPILLDVETGQVILNAESSINPSEAVRDIEWHYSNNITYVTHAGLLQSIDVRNNNVIYKNTDPFQSVLYCVKSYGGHAIVAGSSQYSRCVLFDRRKTMAHVQMYFTQEKSSPVYSLDFDSTRLVAAADRGVAVLNFNINTATARVRDYSQVFDVVRNGVNQLL